MPTDFPALRFSGQLRPSQVAAVEIAQRKIAAGHDRLHIVAPPGSGKTVLGLYLWAECLRVPALVLSPNSAIQAQWAARVDLFSGDAAAASFVSTDPKSPALFTSLTYQSVTLPQRGTDESDAEAIGLWCERLVDKGQAKDIEEATAWIDDLRRHNPKYFDDRLGGYRKELRDAAALGGDAMRLLHSSSLATLDRLKQQGVGLIILDECHHLLSHWGRVLAEVHQYFEHPVVLGLTATPPDRRGQKPEDVERYDAFFGPIDYEVPVPAVVKDGYLAPYQDLVQFVRPKPDELAFIANADKQLERLVDELCQGELIAARPASDGRKVKSKTRGGKNSKKGIDADLASNSADNSPPTGEVSPTACAESLPSWLIRVLAERQLPVGTAKDWTSFQKRDADFATAARVFLQSREVPFPPDVPPLSSKEAVLLEDVGMSVLVPVLDRYIRHRLRASEHAADHALAEQAIARLRMLGVQITETGSRACASPVGRVLMYAGGKVAALIPILNAERRALGDRIRAVVVTDFERTSAVSSEVRHLLDEEAGGAIAAFRTLLKDPATDDLHPVLVTGSSVLIDDDLADRFREAAAVWMAAKGFDVTLQFGEEDGFHVLTGSGGDWCPRVYVAMITDLFQQGLTKCLVGTRGLLGEGWDATKVNVLIDLTTVTTSTSVNQLRGRSLRLDSDEPDKLADNWDVICLAPEFTKGLDDYARFIDKHNTLFGLTDDGAVEKGVGHVHAAFTEIKPEGVEDSMTVLNAEMLERPLRRAAFKELWRIGEPYHSEPIHALEIRPGEASRGDGGFPPFPAANSPWSDESLAAAVSAAVLGALRAAQLIPVGKGELQVATRSGGYVRAFLKHADEAASKLFSEALQEALGPLENPRYVVPRFVDLRTDTWFSRFLPRMIGRYFQKSNRALAMLHAVPSALAKNKELVELYQFFWNLNVSPGDAVFTQRDTGKELLDLARQTGAIPRSQLHRKEVFM